MTKLDNTYPENFEKDPEISEEIPLWSDIERDIRDEIEEAIKFQNEVIKPTRETNWDRYYGRPLGDEIKGRSQYMSRDLLETVEWILPNLIMLFVSKDNKMHLKVYNPNPGQDQNHLSPTQLGKVVNAKIFNDLYTDDILGLFTAFYVWFKDALISGSSFIKVFWETKTRLEEIKQQMDQKQFQQLKADPSFKLKEASLSPTGQFLVTGTKEVIEKDQLVIDNIPHWEAIFEEYTRTINDDSGKGFTTVVTLDYLRNINALYSDDEPFFKNLESITQESANTKYSFFTQDSEEKNYKGYTVLNSFIGGDRKGPKKRIQLTEWYTKFDINGDGFLEDIVVWLANNTMLRWELNENPFVPICKISPILDCYKFQGIAYADLLVELQNLKTALTRKLLDNFDLQNSGRWFFKSTASLDLERFLQNVPGDVFKVNPEHVKNIGPQGFDSSQLALLEYVESVKENRTGSTRYNQGTDASTLNKTAHGVQTIMTASLKRIELIGALFAENGIKDLYRKAAHLLQQNIKEPFIAKVNGEEIQVFPQDIQGRVEVHTDMGLDEQAGKAESQKLLQMLAVLNDQNKSYPGLITPEKAHNITAKYITSLGYDADNFISSLNVFLKATQQQQQQQQYLEQLQMKMAELKQQLEQKNVDIKEVTAFGDIAEAQAKLKSDFILKTKEIEQKKSSEENKNKVDLFKQVFSQMTNFDRRESGPRQE